MPWCPNCKNEYKSGITTCADCNVTLVDSPKDITPETCDVMDTKSQTLAEKFIRYLNYSGITDATMRYEDETSAYVVMVSIHEKKEALKHFRAFYEVEIEPQETEDNELIDLETNDSNTTENDNDIPETFDDLEDSNPNETSEFTEDDSSDLDTTPEETLEDSSEEELSDEDSLSSDSSYKESSATTQTSISNNSKRAYIKKREQYNDVHSSAVMFLVFGIAWLAILILNLVGILRIFQGTVTYVGLAIVFVAFIYFCITSFIKAKEIKTQIPQEEELTKTIFDWLEQTLTTENVLQEESVSSEILYYHRIHQMKSMIESHFGEIDDSYLDCILEEYYNSHFEKEA